MDRVEDERLELERLGLADGEGHERHGGSDNVSGLVVVPTIALNASLCFGASKPERKPPIIPDRDRHETRRPDLVADRMQLGDRAPGRDGNSDRDEETDCEAKSDHGRRKG